jgi:hypothetical protein
MRDHKVSLTFWVTLLVVESSLLPIAFFYGLWYGTNLRHGICTLPSDSSPFPRPHAPPDIGTTADSYNPTLTSICQPCLVFAIITACFGLVTGIEFGLRCLKLILKRDTYRPLGVPRWHFDLTHWTLSLSYTAMTAILISASIPEPPLTRPLAMPPSMFFIQVGAQMVFSGVMCYFEKPAPFRISSVHKGRPFPPMVLTVLEDIVGVDGGGGRVYRQAVLERYAKSERFRDMIIRLNWFWGVPGLLVGIGTLLTVWLVPMEEIAYGLGELQDIDI